jgi:26S proteasome regulatory subunit N5
VASQYYRRIRGARLADLVRLSSAELEEEISSMVSDGSVYAKIDRPNDIIRFAATKSPDAILTAWSNDISELLTLVEKTAHLITKEMTAQ